MLKRLELVGFKSFADRTRFDFPPGVTAVVGPNGSGKSNVVDAVKWILGEQSAKSLRGGEMADVIFNGSTSRKSLGMAEVNLTFDNAAGTLNAESGEVMVTRRVYRDGTGEYLINGRPSRLKDIKDLFLGSGAGGGAYCIIEQGRVDALLQASKNERRVIFEEAAGVSRFKAKKIETLRRLERVEGNLTRLRDILAEVDKQLRRVRLEAAKAQKYQEFTARLKELRVGLGLADHRRLTGELEEESRALEAYRGELAEAASRTAGWEARLAELDAGLAGGEDALRAGESELAAVRQAVAAGRSEWGHAQRRAAELASEAEDAGRKRAKLGAAILELVRAGGDARSSLDEVAARLKTQQGQVRLDSAGLDEADQKIAALGTELDELRAGHMELVRRDTTLRNEVVNLRRLLDDAASLRGRMERKAAGLRAEADSLDVVLSDLSRTEADLHGRLRNTRAALAEQAESRRDFRSRADAARQSLSSLNIERNGLHSRVEVLEELEASQEGVSAGVRDVLAALGGDNSVSRGVLGLVADFLDVPREHAGLIDLALGDLPGQCFAVIDDDALDRLLGEADFAGRVSFVPATGVDTPSAGAVTADTLVSVNDPRAAGLPRRLLGRTFVADDLAAGRDLCRGAGVRCVTRAGELIEADGTVTVGPAAMAGILSRKSELRELRGRIADLDEAAAAAEADLAQAERAAESLDAPIRSLEESLAGLSEEAGDLTTQTALRRKRREDVAAELAQAEADLAHLLAQIRQQEADLAEREAAAESLEAEVAAAEQRTAECDAAEAEWTQRRTDRERALSASRVALARLKEQHAAAKSHAEQLEADAIRRGHEVTALEQAEAALADRRADADLAALAASASLADLHVLKEQLQGRVSGLSRRRDADRRERSDIAGKLHDARQRHEGRLGEAHRHEVRCRELEATRRGLLDRLREDYEIDPAEMTDEVPPVEDRDAAEAEADDLRRKLSRLGSVSLESLEELAAVEERAHDLRAQHDDLAAARRTLEEIIERVDGDSRRLFNETFAAVRGHFQELFRKLFGGGMADVVLEDPEQVLDTGIEVVARPPGKELRSISLMSGGEKTLTAVALLLAIFRSKPSPFCLLDEVDAALDEANTHRLAGVVREFAEASQFIIITHKKRTMAVADVLYGVTMQESGVSKRVAVRFEDWPEDSSAAA